MYSYNQQMLFNTFHRGCETSQSLYVILTGSQNHELHYYQYYPRSTLQGSSGKNGRRGASNLRCLKFEAPKIASVSPLLLVHTGSNIIPALLQLHTSYLALLINSGIASYYTADICTVNIFKFMSRDVATDMKITVSHQPFSDQFSDVATYFLVCLTHFRSSNVIRQFVFDIYHCYYS